MSSNNCRLFLSNAKEIVETCSTPFQLDELLLVELSFLYFILAQQTMTSDLGEELSELDEQEERANMSVGILVPGNLNSTSQKHYSRIDKLKQAIFRTSPRNCNSFSLSLSEVNNDFRVWIVYWDRHVQARNGVAGYQGDEDLFRRGKFPVSTLRYMNR